MKSYEERLPLIDAAIRELKKWPKQKGLQCPDRCGVFYIGAISGALHRSKGVFMGSDFVCIREEFYQRKAGRQNKPDWSSAPEWANWLAQHDFGSWGWFRSKPKRQPDGWYSGDKQKCATNKGEVIGSWQDTLEKRPKQEEQDMNDWYDKGELPPVGERCISVDPSGIECSGEIVKHSSDGECALFVRDDESTVFWQKEFRPLRTETDKLVEQMERSFESTGCVFTSDHRALAEHLIEQGYRKAKPMSEQEFMKQCVDICGHGDARLYRAGCRFIEQVKV